AATVFDGARLAVTLRRTRAAHLARLRAELDPAAVVLYLPYLFTRSHGIRATRQMAEALAAELEG
ncbi:MAG: anion-transporting ATPase, partial [Acidimicrobiales bacterium]